MLTRVVLSEAPLLAELYHRSIGCPGCIWNEEYPNLQDAENDIRLGNAWCLRDAGGQIMAACSPEEDEIRSQPYCRDKESPSWEVSRVVVAEAYRGQGLARKMILQLCDMLAAQGITWLRLLVSPLNLPAYHSYEKAGFTGIGECELYGVHWIAMEKRLTD